MRSCSKYLRIVAVERRGSAVERRGGAVERRGNEKPTVGPPQNRALHGVPDPDSRIDRSWLTLLRQVWVGPGDG